jgi:tetratricopeptide (TPR) repeat protein
MKEINSFKKPSLISVLALFFITLSSGALFAQDQEIKSAIRQLNSEQPSKALETIKKASQTYPDAVKVWYYLGYVQAKTGDKKNAEISFQKGIEKDPKDGLSYAGKGHLRMLDNNPTEGKQFFDQALSISKSKVPAVLRAVAEGYLVYESKYVNEALALLQKAKSANDNDAETHILLGDTYLLQNKGGESVSSYERAAKLDPSNGLPLYKIALVFFRSKNTKVAEENLLKATTADPNFAPAYKELGELYYTTKEAEKAVKAQEAYLKITENPEKGMFPYAFYLFMAKNYGKANEIFKTLVQKPDVTPTTLRYYAYSLVESGNLEEAKKTFDLYFSKSTDVSAADYNYYGKMLQKQGADSLAVQSYAKSYAKDTTQVEMLETVAELYYKLKKYDSAIVAYKRLIPKRTRPKPGDYFNLGRSYYLTKQYPPADTAFQKVIELAPNMTVGYLWEGRTKANLDPETKDGLAKPYFEQLIEKGSANPEKSKNELIEAYSYLGYYYYLKDDVANAKGNFEKLLQIDPKNQKALEFLEAIKKPKPQG